uniref:Glutathione synthetase n=1 Tax=Globodera pallida TaxID=36090 RepID=A0A183CFL0_GLOPA
MLSNLLNLAICVEFFVVFTAKFLTNASPTEIDHKSETLDVNIEAMVEDAINWAHIHGLVVRTKEMKLKNDIAMFLPFALFPTPFPREIFEQARDVQTAMQLLYFRVASDFKFLREHLQPVAETNEVLQSLLEILQKVHDEGIKQPLTVVLMRSDYMCNVDKNEHTGEPVYGLKQIEVNIGQIGGLFNAPCITDLHRRTMAHAGLDTSNVFMPINEPDAMVVDALIMAWKAFGDKDAIVLVLPSMVERFFPSSNEADTVVAICKTFAGMWGLDDPEDEATKSVIQNAIDHPDKYVLKPCREGGGNNFWGKEIPEKLREFSPAELGGHILMQKLTPLAVPNLLVRPLQDVQFENVVSELGIFGFLLGNVHTKSVQHNVQRGHYARSKSQDAQEGGVYGGAGVVDSPLLF